MEAQGRAVNDSATNKDFSVLALNKLFFLMGIQ